MDRKRHPRWYLPAAIALTLLGLHTLFSSPHLTRPQALAPPQCRALHASLDPPASLLTSRTTDGSDRFVAGTPPVLIRNAKILTGGRNGTEIVFGDIFLDKGIVLGVGYIPRVLTERSDLQIIDARGKWISPGIVDAHSHLGVGSAPELNGADDTNSVKAPILPWLRSIDGLNTHDDAYRLAIAGGVTTAQILPGSANNIGGQAFLIKLRPTAERSTSAMILEPPLTLGLNSSDTRPKWRHMKHACGENPSRVYSQTRMDSAWEFRRAYNEARQVRDAQDAFCARAEAGLWDGVEAFPESLQWEALVDVLRGRVKLSVHCYEAVDLDQLVRLTNEFKFPVASIHHAGETYLVPNLLKKAWGNIPSIALFASNFRKKREAYRGSEFAPRILSDNGLPVIMKSDHPVLNSRYLMYEAQQAHYYSLNPALAIASVTSTPADALGVGWRVGRLMAGYDADLVIWDSHPLALGATPVQVYIDGIPQLEDPAVLAPKPPLFQDVPQTPDWEEEVRRTIEYEGLPPLEGKKTTGGQVLFVNVTEVWRRAEGGVVQLASAEEGGRWQAGVEHGAIRCIAREGDGGCAKEGYAPAGTTVVDLMGGVLAPGLTTFGSDLGLSEIMLEASTTDGRVFDPLTMVVPGILRADTVVGAVDGLQFGGRNTLYAYRGGVTTAVVAPMGRGFMRGMGVAFSTGAINGLADGAVVQAETALHVAVHSDMLASVSTQIAALRNKLFFDPTGPWTRVVGGEIPLVVSVHNADIMATLLSLKAEFDSQYSLGGVKLRMTFAGATEAHRLAEEIGKAGVSVVLAPARPYPETWDRRRVLPGPPLSHSTSVTKLLEHGVNVALGVTSDYDARNARFEVAWAALDADGALDYRTAMALATTNMDAALGLTAAHSHSLLQEEQELVVYQGGGVFDFESKVVGVVDGRRGVVELF